MYIWLFHHSTRCWGCFLYWEQIPPSFPDLVNHKNPNPNGAKGGVPQTHHAGKRIQIWNMGEKIMESVGQNSSQQIQVGDLPFSTI